MSNKNKNVLEYQASYGSVKVCLWVGSYQDNRSLYIGLVDKRENEEFTDITVNMDESAGFEPYCAAVKNYSENEGMEQFIEKYELGKPTGQLLRSGYVKVPVYQFDKERLLELSLNGVHEYEPERK